MSEDSLQNGNAENGNVPEIELIIKVKLYFLILGDYLITLPLCTKGVGSYLQEVARSQEEDCIRLNC